MTPQGTSQPVSEVVQLFGKEQQLFGIASLPPNGASTSPYAFILLNSGLIHRVGPYRAYVELARRVADSGTLSLRMDHVGVGDGPAPEPGALRMEQVRAEVAAAMDHLTKVYGINRFILGGICYGALESHKVALGDPRVEALVMLDSYAYRTPIYYWQALLRKALAPRGWPAIAGRFAESVRQRLAGAPEAPAAATEADEYFTDWPDAQQARAELSSLVERGVRSLFVYTGGWSDFVDERQFDEMFPNLRGRGVRVQYLADADHTYFSPYHREAMIRAVVDFTHGLATNAL
jgi:pimeloyl-ACP methyl ester carboxylesterase